MRFMGILFSSVGRSVAATTVSNPKPWEISSLVTFSPPDRPGSGTYNSGINLTILDPNDTTVSPTICLETWTFTDLPYNKTANCTDVPGGAWTFEMLESESKNPSPTTDFILRFELVKNGGGQFVGASHFAIGDNLSGLCSAYGTCEFELKDANTPFPVNHTKVDGWR